jgi:hypothetical protein
MAKTPMFSMVSKPISTVCPSMRSPKRPDFSPVKVSAKCPDILGGNLPKIGQNPHPLFVGWGSAIVIY